MQLTWARPKSSMKPDMVWWLLLATGIILRVRQFLVYRSFWGDEASLAFNLVNRSFSGLTQLLDYHQAAPIGFLFIEKALLIILGNTEYVLRLFPLASGVLATYFIYRIAREHFGIAGLFAVLMFSISWWLVYYSSELKQYSSDVMIALMLVYLAGNCLKEKAMAKDFLSLGIAGTVTIWISHPSVFILTGIGLVLFLQKINRKEYVPWIWILGMGFAWLASFGIEYLVSLRHIIADEFLVNYWKKTYIPLPLWSDKAWYFDTYYSFLFYAFHRGDNLMAVVTLVLTGIGAVSLLIRDRKIGLLVIFPFVVTVIASALQRYPLKNRFILFLVPFALLLMAEGFRGIYWLVSKWKANFAGVFSAALALAVVWLIAPITYEKVVSKVQDDIRPVFAYVAGNQQPDDIIYVFHATDPAFHYYAPFYGLDTGPVIVGVYGPGKRITLKNYHEDIVKLVGNGRVWFIFSEILDCASCVGEGTQADYLEEINRFGIMLDSFDGSGGNAYLYNLKP